mgnify:CR=1 FL=1
MQYSSMHYLLTLNTTFIIGPLAGLYFVFLQIFFQVFFIVEKIPLFVKRSRLRVQIETACFW